MICFNFCAFYKRFLHDTFCVFVKRLRRNVPSSLTATTLDFDRSLNLLQIKYRLISNEKSLICFFCLALYLLVFLVTGNFINITKGNRLTNCPPGAVYSQKNWVGVCRPLPKTLTLFMTKIFDFPYPIYEANG